MVPAPPRRRPSPPSPHRPEGARPFLKWAGGKTQLLGPIGEALPPRIDGPYLEPFLGSGAVFFHLAAAGRLRGGAHLSDSNAALVEAWLGVKEETEAVIALLEEHRRHHHADPESHYYATRAGEPRSRAARTARLLYLNKTCYNGLWRVNRSGRFNVPMGRYENPSVFDADGLRAAAQALRDAEIRCEPWDRALRRATKRSVVYLDPPYQPVSATANFTSYTADRFSLDDQRALADGCAALRDRGVTFLLSNSDVPELRAIYRERGLRIHSVVTARRAINSDAGRRGRVNELLVDGGAGGGSRS